jgi:hypothetical protein
MVKSKATKNWTIGESQRSSMARKHLSPLT